MGNEQAVGSISDWSGVLKDFFRQVHDGSITLKMFKEFVGHQNQVITEWEVFYREVFGIKIDLSGTRIPKKEKGFDRLIIVAKEMTPQRLYDKCSALFPCWKWAEKSLDLDDVIKSDRSGLYPYAIWVRNRVEADGELKNLSYDDLQQKNISGVTLEERLLYELKYFRETSGHLDVDNVTLCTGSLYSDDHVPVVYWYNGKLKVVWYHSAYRHFSLRSRQAVSF